MPIPTEVLQKIRRIQITTAKKASDSFAGEYKSVFKGRGMEFVEVREYLPGDDIRSIDWNVTARMGRPFIKKFVEERELTVMLLLDVSRSSCFGTVNRLKRDLATEVCAVMGAAATKNNDKVGLIVFTDRIECFLPARKGTNHVFRVIREALYHKAEGHGTDIAGCIQYLNRLITKSAVVFLISDFYEENLKKPLSVASKKHDIVAVQITDPRDFDMPNVGVVKLDDAETGKSYFLDTSNPTLRREYKRKAEEKEETQKKLFYSIGMDRVVIDTAEPYEDALIQFFRKRQMRMMK
ncbi:MAG: DUF58 domain-containing protein [Candidatus Omnitrophica bacterium]|nr:DUF58 domain-containing protein [Candidatus Omnitrophota bacterium]